MQAFPRVDGHALGSWTVPPISRSAHATNLQEAENGSGQPAKLGKTPPLHLRMHKRGAGGQQQSWPPYSPALAFGALVQAPGLQHLDHPRPDHSPAECNDSVVVGCTDGSDRRA